MVKFGSLKQLKQLVNKSKGGLTKYAKWKGKLYKKGLPLAQKALNFINKAIIKNDKSVIKSILTKVVPGGNYINMAMDIVGEVIDSNMIGELGDILTKADNGGYSSPSELFNDLMKLAEKGKQTIKTGYNEVKEIKKLYDEEHSPDDEESDDDLTEGDLNFFKKDQVEEKEVESDDPRKIFGKPI